MVEVLQEDCPWIFGIHRLHVAVQHDWLKNFRHQDVGGGLFKYYRIDTKVKRKYMSKGR